MSPAPYPPFQAGDDVDASFFDQLGDELDFPESESVPHKQQGAGNVNVSAAPGNGEVLSASGSWIHKQELQAEMQECSQQDGNAQVDFELDDAFSELSIAKVDALQSTNSADFHCLSNGDIHAVNSEVELVPGLVPAAALSNEESEPESSQVDPVLDNGDPDTSISTCVDKQGKDDMLPDSDSFKEVATFSTSDATASSVKEETSSKSISDEEVKSAEASIPRKQTINVTEVQWSDFGASSGFGSFSDLFSTFPADPSQQQAETYSSGADFFQLTADAPLDLGSYPQQQLASAGAFDVHQASNETQTFTAQMASDLPTGGQESQTSVQSSSEEPSTYWQSQGQEQQTLSDQVYQSEWQNPYPGWWYSAVTGEWRQEIPGDGGAGVESTWDSSGQYQIQGQTGNDQSYWQTQESNVLSAQTSEQVVYGNGDVVANQSVTGAYQNEWNEQNQSNSGQSKLTDNPLFEESVVQQSESSWPSTEQAGAVIQSTSWEDLYPGWYYDYQTQEWKATNPPAPGSDVGTSQASEVHQETLPLPPAADVHVNYGESLSKGHSSAGWAAMQDQHETSTTQYTHERITTHDVTANSLQFGSSNSSSAFPLRSSPNATVAEVGSRQWTGTQSNVQFGYSSSYYQVGQSETVRSKQQGEVEQSQLNMLNQHYSSLDQAPYNMQHIDPHIAPEQLPDSIYTPLPAKTFTQISTYAPQIPRQQTPELQYNQFPTPQVQSFTAQAWPNVSPYHMQQPVDNSYYSQYHSHYDPLTPPKSTVEASRTSVGRPPHVLTTFGFGGKLVVMKLKDPVSLHASDGKQSVSSGQAWVPGPIHVHSLSQIVAQSVDHGRPQPGNLYFSSLTRQTFSGPLAGGSVSNKELSKWLEERGASCRIEEPDCKNPGSLSMLWGLLKVACQHYGKFRSAVGTTGITSQEEDGPEVALANLLTSGANQGSWTMGSFASTVCLQPVPSEHQLQTTASEVKKLLVMGKRKEALKHALQGQLWGPALVLARQLGEKFYTDAVAQMAQCQFLPGSPMRTLSLLIAGQPAEVFSGKAMPVTLSTSMEIPTSGGFSQDGLGSMLEEWQENLSIMAANRTNGDDRVISHLGDCLWKVKGEVAAAHICYLVADANFESFTSTARLCLVGADHWKYPRTFTTPEAIQRTEVYEYSKVLGNPQFTLVPFQPYKLIYASMLAEAGKTSEALRYCQAVLKTLKTSSRVPEVETCRQAALALEERLRIHTQGGHAVSLAPGKIVRNLFSALDRGIHGIIGGPPQSSDQVQDNSKVDTLSSIQDQYSLTGVSPGRNSAPMVPSLSAEKLKDVKKLMPQRSVSEPDFGSASMKGKSVETKANSGAGTTGGYLGRWSSTLFEKAGGIVGLRKKEAKLGEKNKFHYDEKLKQWIEEGAQPVEEVALPPPPTTANFVNKVEEPTPDFQTGIGVGPGPRMSSGTPPVPPSNQFSARTKQGVRSRYVDTFNKGGNATPSKPVISSLFPTVKAAAAPMQPMSFFVPGPSVDNPSTVTLAKTENGTAENHVENHSESAFGMEDRTNASQNTAAENSVQQGASMISAMHRVASAGNTSAFGGTEPVEANDSTGRGSSNGGMDLANGYHSRANSWGGYPSNFQTSQFVAEPPPNLSQDNSAAITSFSVYNGFSSHSSATSTPAVSSYFPSPPTKAEAYNSNPGDASVEASLPPHAAVAPFTTPVGSGVSDGRAATEAQVSLVGDDLQEVEF